MAYINFARKYRPQTFDEVVGQEHVCRTLKNAIRDNRVSHAYLFTGSRGVGKTSTARILAKTLNCHHPVDHNPCNECQNCIEITEGRSLDVLEIDGASNRGIDQVRDLRESVKYPPANSRYRVFIIDEVHMLTKEAFNALLKTLEEPPPHVVFIFATTEPMKVPSTIISRCQRFDFHRIPVSLLVRQLKRIVEDEKVEIDDDILLLIARKADGSLRDAESLLDQVLSLSSKSPRLEDVRKLLGVMDASYFFKTGAAISSKNLKELFRVSDEVYQSGISPVEYLVGLIDHFRTLLAINVGGVSETLDLPGSVKDMYQEESKFWRPEDLIRIMKILTDALSGIKGALNQKTFLETVLMRLGMLDKSVSITELLKMIGGVKVTVSHTDSLRDTGIFASNERKSVTEDNKGEESLPGGVGKPRDPAGRDRRSDEIFRDKPGDIDSEISKIWHTILAKIHEDNPSLSNFLEHGRPMKLEGNVVEVKFYRDSEFYYRNIKQRSSVVEKAIGDVLGRDVKLKLLLVDEESGRVGAPGLDQAVNVVIDIFDGEIVEKKEVKGGES